MSLESSPLIKISVVIACHNRKERTSYFKRN